MTRRLPILLLAGLWFLNGCAAHNPAATIADSQRLDRLLQLSDTYERAATYLRKCRQDLKMPPPTFTANYRMVSDTLFDEALRLKKLKPDYVAEQLSKRRADLHKALQRTYEQEGCTGSEADQARAFYDRMSRWPTDDLQRWLRAS